MTSFITRAIAEGWGTATPNFPIFTASVGVDDFLTNSDTPPGCDWNPLPGALTMERLAIRASAAAGTNFTFQPFKGIPRVDTGPSVTLLSGNTDAEGVVAVTVNSPSVIADLATEAVGWDGTSSGGSIFARTVWSYSIASPYDKYNIVAGGFSGNDFFASEAERFLGPTNSSSSTVSDAVNLTMPVAGTFKYFMAVLLLQNALADSNLTCSFDVNGASVITAVTDNSNTQAIAKEGATSAPVVAGDKINFRFSTDGTFDNNHRGRVYAAIGFLPS